MFETIIMVLLPKATGGWRSIGFFTSVLCGSTSDGLAEQLRQAGSEIPPGPTGSGRLRTPANSRPGGPAWQEFATSVGFSAASSLIDRAKAFEHIQFSYLWRMEVKHGFPLRFLRFLIGLYGVPALLLVENVSTKVVRSGGSAVVAGCVHATTLM